MMSYVVAAHVHDTPSTSKGNASAHLRFVRHIQDAIQQGQ